MARIETPEHPLLAQRGENNILAIVLTGERGLAGAFNATSCARPTNFSAAHAGKKIITIPVGKKGRDSLKPRRIQLCRANTSMFWRRVDFKTAREIANLVAELYAKEEIDAVYLIFNEFKNVMAPTLTVEKLLAAWKPCDDGANPRRTRRTQKRKVRRDSPSTTSTSSRQNRSLANCCRATSKRRSCARCWNLPRPNTPRA